MQVFDASSVIYAWDNYPIVQFPPLWEWIQVQIEHRQLVMPRVAFEEVEDKMPDCAKWLSRNNLELLETSNSILQTALRIKDLLGIVCDNYHPKGVDENDIITIATAYVQNAELVSNEGRQQTTPLILAKCKIPAVCAMSQITILCLNFIEYIKRSGAIFR